MTPCQVHLDHALPLLPELGLEHLVPLFTGGGEISLDAGSLTAILAGVAAGAKSKSLRKFVAVSRTSAEGVFAWESDPAAEASALKEAALLPVKESAQAVLDFFSSFGISLNVTPGSSPSTATVAENQKETPGTPTES